jgi:hypothetical protein
MTSERQAALNAARTQAERLDLSNSAKGELLDGVRQIEAAFAEGGAMNLKEKEREEAARVLLASGKGGSGGKRIGSRR